MSRAWTAFDMRIVSRREGRWVMNAHRTPDGRAATPTVIVLDDKGEKVGCWTERLRFSRTLLMEAIDEMRTNMNEDRSW